MKTPESNKIYYYHRSDGKEMFAYINEFNEKNYDFYFIDTIDKKLKKFKSEATKVGFDSIRSKMDSWVVLQGPENAAEYRRAFIEIIFLHL